MSGPIDLTNKKFDKLTVLNKTEKRKGEKILWECQCECGKIVYKTSTDLKRQTVNPKSCGCVKIKKDGSKLLKDLTGQRFGNLIVLYRVANQNGKVVWKCQCDCGNTTEVTGQNLKNGNTRSCGCSKKQYENLSLKKFGYLQPISIEYVIKGLYYWKCKCDCGNETVVSSKNLKNGNTRSCGCLRMSIGEKKIVKLLNEHNIHYQTQYMFDDLLLPSGYKARFDFYVNNQYIIECDGKQHFQFIGGWYTKERFERLVLNDSIKNQYCANNKIPIIRIPYSHLKNLCIEDLQLETSNFIQDYANKPQEEILT